MQERIHKTESGSLNHSNILGAICLAVGGFGFLIFLVMLFFLVWLLVSRDLLIANIGRAWEYESVRELFVMSLIVFAVHVALPLFAAYSLLKRRRWAKASVIMVTVISLLISLFLITGAVSMEGYGMLSFSIPFLTLSIYAFWVIYRGALSKTHSTGAATALISCARLD